MLRASIEYQGGETDLRTITDGTKAAESGVEGGDELLAFAEAAVGGDPASVATARDALRARLGGEAAVDAAAVVGNFQRMVRIADGTGIPLDTPVRLLTDDFREEIGLDAFVSARGKAAGPVAKLAGTVMRPVSNAVFRLLGRRERSRG
jgi:hypothetical protein